MAASVSLSVVGLGFLSQLLWTGKGDGCLPDRLLLSPGRYHRLPLPEQGAPLEAQFDAFISILRVSGAEAVPGETVSLEMFRAMSVVWWHLCPFAVFVHAVSVYAPMCRCAFAHP